MQNQFSPRSLGEVGSWVSSSSGPVQGGGLNTPPSSRKNFIFRNKRLVRILVLFLILLILAIVAASLFIFKKPPADLAAKVGDQKIMRDQVSQFANECQLEQKEAVEFLVDDIVLSTWSSDEKITVSPEGQRYPQEGAENVQLRSCEITLEKVNRLREKLTEYAVGFREGKFIVVNFDRFSPNPFLPPPEATDGTDLVELQKKEREYADNLVKSIYDDLKAKKLTFEQALEKVQKDPNVGLESVYGAAIQSGPFLAVDYIEKRGLLRFDDVRGKIDALKEGEFSEPFVQKVDISLEEGNPRLADSRWIIAKVDKIGEGGEKADDIISKTRQKYGVRIYLK